MTKWIFLALGFIVAGMIGCDKQADAQCCGQAQSAPQSVYMAETVNVTTMVPVTQQVATCVEYQRVEQSCGCETSVVAVRRRPLREARQARKANRASRKAARQANRATVAVVSSGCCH